MARRRRTSDFEVLLEMLSWFFSHVPPWSSIPVAIIGFFLIPALMTTQFQTSEFKSAVEMFGWVIGGIWAIVWLAGGVGGWITRRRQATSGGTGKVFFGGGPMASPRVAAPSRPVCPVCGSFMVLRRAKRGAHAGTKFWGCPHYPKCKGITNLDGLSS